MKKFLLKIVDFFFTRKMCHMLILMVPFMLIGHWILPVVALTYTEFIIIVLLVMIWDDLLDIKNKLGE